MERIGVREMRSRAAEIFRRVREDRAEFEVTYRGRPVARAVPVRDRSTDEAVQVFLEKWDRLGDEIGRDWPAGVSAVDAVRDVRREL